MKTRDIRFEAVEPPSAEDVIAFRHRLGLSQVSMASLLGVKPQQYRHIEKGRRRASPLLARIISWIDSGFQPPEFTALGVEPDRRPRQD